MEEIVIEEIANRVVQKIGFATMSVGAILAIVGLVIIGTVLYLENRGYI